jgi:hypothetical protein
MTYARILILIICLFLLLSPILLSPPRLPAELLIIDQWVSEEQSESVSGGFADTQWISLESDGDLIYVDDQGRIGPGPRKTSISNTATKVFLIHLSIIISW